MSAFVPSATSSSFCNANTLNAPKCSTKPAASNITMKDTIPDPAGPATSKYLQFIGPDRLNKAPVIAINAFKNEQYNTLSVDLCEVATNISNGLNLKNGVDIDESLLSVNLESKYSKYYDPSTVHEAPDVSVYYCGPDSKTRPTVSIIQSQAPLRIELAQQILDNYAGNAALSPTLYPAFSGDKLNKAPNLTIIAPEDTEDGKGLVEVETSNMPLNLYTAELILSEYRS